MEMEGETMFLHEFLYEIKRVLRQKDELFWVLLFPMILGTMFSLAFGNINNASENFHTIPVAICIEKGENGKIFSDVLEELSADDDTPLLKLTFTDQKSAQDLLKDNHVRGIFTCGEDITLTCASDNDPNSTLSMEQSILESILRQYRPNTAVFTDIAAKNPSGWQELIPLMEEYPSYGKELHLTSGNMDGTVQYFFNLIAMACLFTCFAGSQIAVKNQANLSDLGARKCISPTNKFLSVAAEFFSCLFAQFFCIVVNLCYLVYVIKTDFGASLPLLFFTAFFGCMMGISFGFFIGSIGKISEPVRMGIMISCSMLCCFLSGLMISDMRFLVEDFCPLINRINPAVLISDSFLTLNIYGTTSRYTGNLLSLLIITFFFLFAGCIMIRRKTYASL